MTRAPHRIRQPRVAELVASRLRDDILSGRLKEGDVLPSQERLFQEFGVCPPALREAIHLLETDGLVSVRRGNVGGAVVHAPSAARTAQLISMVLQARAATPADVSGALMHLEPICAGMCAARADRMTEVVPYLEAEIERQTAEFDDVARYVPNARRFHEALCLAVRQRTDDPADRLTRADLVGARVGGVGRRSRADERSVGEQRRARKTRRAALRDHQRLLEAIRDGQRGPGRHGSRRTTWRRHVADTLAFGQGQTIEAKRISDGAYGADGEP